MKNIRNWKLEIRNLEREVLSAIEYFSFFNYPPTFIEIYTFLKKKTSKKRLASILEEMKEKAAITSYEIKFNFKFQIENCSRYTLGEYSKQVKSEKLKVNKWVDREKYSKQKIKKIQTFLKILSWFPQIQLVGLSGTVAVMNAKENDDIDLFIISKKNRIWTARFISLTLAECMGIRRKRIYYPRRPSQILYKNKVCLNLFFDESDLAVPKHKQTEYVAHEVLQMKPVVQKGDIYMRFIDTNRWAFDIFPNAREINPKFQISNPKQYQNSNDQNSKHFEFVIWLLEFIWNLVLGIWNFMSDWLEQLLKNLQLYLINKHKTTEIITDTQLWFFPEDFEKKIIKNKL